MPKHEVLGYTVPVDENGKKSWPIEMKREAVRRIKYEGATPKSIALELGTTEALVRKWHVADQKKNGGAPVKVAAAFAEVVTKAEAPSIPPPTVPHQTSACRLLVGTLTLEFPPDIPEEDLLKFIRVARAAS
mgnify:CR=1 FL=1